MAFCSSPGLALGPGRRCAAAGARGWFRRGLPAPSPPQPLRGSRAVTVGRWPARATARGRSPALSVARPVPRSVPCRGLAQVHVPCRAAASGAGARAQVSCPCLVQVHVPCHVIFLTQVRIPCRVAGLALCRAQGPRTLSRGHLLAAVSRRCTWPLTCPGLVPCRAAGSPGRSRGGSRALSRATSRSGARALSRAGARSLSRAGSRGRSRALPLRGSRALSRRCRRGPLGGAQPPPPTPSCPAGRGSE